jgi:hypothetical protein
MPAKIDETYAKKIHGFVRRNLCRDKPISGAFSMLARWRNLDRLLTMEASRDFAIVCIDQETRGLMPENHAAGSFPDTTNVVPLNFARQRVR